MANELRQTSCILCYVNCGLEVATEGRAITRVRGDKSNARSRGYLCQKAQRLTFYGNHADRLTTPLRRRPDGTHEPVTWDVALAEIAARLRALRDAHGGDAFAFYGGGGQGNHLGGAYFRTLKEVLGATKHFNALSQEKTGDFWVNGRLFGNQVCHTAEDVEHADLLVVVGCNPWMAHGFQSARNAVNEIKSSPDRRMIVIDPRRTEVADVADLHLQLKPGTDAFLLSAMLAIILRRGGEARDFLDAHTVGFDEVAAVLRQVPIESWVAHADVPMADVERAVDLMLAAQAMCVRVELGIQQSRHSTLNSYLEKLLYLLPGHFGRRGTNNLHTWLQPLFRDSQGERSLVTGQEIIGGLLPTNRFADEVLTDDPRRVRAVWVDSNNPANTAADTARLKEAFRALDLSVVVDVAYTETAALADWVLPAAAQYEKWEATLFNFEWPSNFFHLRAPLFDPLPGTLPEPEIYARVLRAMGELPSDDVLAELRDARRPRPRRDDAARRPACSATSRALVADRARPAILDARCDAARRRCGRGAALGRLPPHRDRARGRRPARARHHGRGPRARRGAVRAACSRAARASSSPRTSTRRSGSWWRTPTAACTSRSRRCSTWLARLDPIAEQPPDDYPFMLVAGQRRMHNAEPDLPDPGVAQERSRRRAAHPSRRPRRARRPRRRLDGGRDADRPHRRARARRTRRCAAASSRCRTATASRIPTGRAGASSTGRA